MVRIVLTKPARDAEGSLVTGEKTFPDSSEFDDPCLPQFPYTHAVIRWLAPPRSDKMLMGVRAFCDTADEGARYIELFRQHDRTVAVPPDDYPMTVVPLFKFFQFPPPWSPVEEGEAWTTPPEWRALEQALKQPTAPGPPPVSIGRLPADPDLTGTLTVTAGQAGPATAAAAKRRYTHILFTQVLPPQCLCVLIKIRGAFTSNAAAVSYGYRLRELDADKLCIPTYTFPVGLLRECPLAPGQTQVRVRQTESRGEREKREKHFEQFRKELAESKEAIQRMDILKSITERDAKRRQQTVAAAAVAPLPATMLPPTASDAEVFEAAGRERQQLQAEIERTEDEHARFIAMTGAPFCDRIYENWKAAAKDRIATLEECVRERRRPPPAAGVLSPQDDASTPLHKMIPVYSSEHAAGTVSSEFVGVGPDEGAEAEHDDDNEVVPPKAAAGGRRQRRLTRRQRTAIMMRGGPAAESGVRARPPPVAATKGTQDAAAAAADAVTRIDVTAELQKLGHEKKIESSAARMRKAARGRREKLAPLKLLRARLAAPVQARRLAEREREALAAADRARGAPAQPAAVEQVLVERPEDLAALPPDVKAQMRVYFEGLQTDQETADSAAAAGGVSSGAQ